MYVQPFCALYGSPVPRNPSRRQNVQAITFPEYPIIYRDKESGDLALTEMEWGVLPTYIDDPKQQQDRRRNMEVTVTTRLAGRDCHR